LTVGDHLLENNLAGSECPAFEQPIDIVFAELIFDSGELPDLLTSSKSSNFSRFGRPLSRKMAHSEACISSYDPHGKSLKIALERADAGEGSCPKRRGEIFKIASGSFGLPSHLGDFGSEGNVGKMLLSNAVKAGLRVKK
jgi:hypothetical protein